MEKILHIHHSLLGAAIMGAGGLIAAFTPDLKPETRLIVGGLTVGIGALLIWDDLTQHIEKKCSFDTIFNLTPCPEKQVVVTSANVVKEAQSSSKESPSMSSSSETKTPEQSSPSKTSA